MSEAELLQVEEFIRNFVTNANAPFTASDIFHAGQLHGEKFSPDVMRRAIWRLVDSGELTFTPEWHLQVA